MRTAATLTALLLGACGGSAPAPARPVDNAAPQAPRPPGKVEVVTDVAEPFRLAISGDQLFVTGGPDGEMAVFTASVEPRSTAQRLHVEKDSIDDVVASGGRVFWSAAEHLRSASTRGGDVQEEGHVAETIWSLWPHGSDVLIGSYVPSEDKAFLSVTGSNGEQRRAMLPGETPIVHAAGDHVLVGTSRGLFKDPQGIHNKMLAEPAHEQGITAIQIDGDQVFFAAFATIERVPLAGGPVTKVADAAGEANALAVDATHVYWSAFVYEDSAIYRAPKPGGDKELVTKDVGEATALVISDGYLYWADNRKNRVARIKL